MCDSQQQQYNGCGLPLDIAIFDGGLRRRPCVSQAIDLIDEAGSRVRLRHAQLPEEARDVDKQLRALLKEKEGAVR